MAMIVMEASSKISPNTMHILLPQYEASGPAAKQEMKAPRSMNELMICWGTAAMFCKRVRDPLGAKERTTYPSTGDSGVLVAKHLQEPNHGLEGTDNALVEAILK